MPPANDKYSILFENEDFLAVNKPSGMFSIPDRNRSGDSLKERLQKKYGEIFPVHRLDKDTSGLILFARNAGFHKYLSLLFESHAIEKYYTGIVSGVPEKPQGLIDAPILEDPSNKGKMIIRRNGKPSQTSYTVMEGHPSYSLLVFQLHTGRTHQIRVHSKHIGHPLACDPLYGDGKPVFLSSVKKNFKLGKIEEERPIINRLALHAYKLVFDDHGTRREIIAPIPKEFDVLMKQIKKG